MGETPPETEAPRPVSLRAGACLQAHRFSWTPRPAPGTAAHQEAARRGLALLHPARAGLAGDHGTQARRCRDPHKPVLAGVPNQRADLIVSSKLGQVGTGILQGRWFSLGCLAYCSPSPLLPQPQSLLSNLPKTEMMFLCALYLAHQMLTGPPVRQLQSTHVLMRCPGP